MDLRGKGSPFFTSTNNLSEGEGAGLSVGVRLSESPRPFWPLVLSPLPVYVRRCGDFVKIVVGVSVGVSVGMPVFLLLLRVFFLLFPLAELQRGVLACVYPHLQRKKRGGKNRGIKSENQSLRPVLWSQSDLLGFDSVREIDGGQTAALLFLVVVVLLLHLPLSFHAGQGVALRARSPAGLQNRFTGRTNLVGLLLLLRGKGRGVLSVQICVVR